MYKIGEFSMLSKATVKALRYYEEEGLIKPCFVDKFTGYRYYETRQLEEIASIVSLREAGLSVKELKRIKAGEDPARILEERKRTIAEEIGLRRSQLEKIEELLKEKTMQRNIVIKEVPSCIVYYKDGKVKDFSGIADFVLSAGQECAALNPDLRCSEPDYCFVSYLDGEYRERDFRIRYAQAVEEAGTESAGIRFMRLPAVRVVSIEHKGGYETLRESYNAVLKYVEEKGLVVAELPRERYIDGCWNKEDPKDYLTEIQIPVR